MGEKRFFLSLSLLLSSLHALLGMLPFLMVWLLVRQLLQTPGQVQLEGLTKYAWLAFAAQVLGILFYFAALVLSHLAGFRVEVALQKKGMERIINKPLGFFDMNLSGRMRKIINDSAGSTHSFLAHQLPDMAATVVTPLSVLLLIALVDWRLGIALLIPILLGFITMGGMMTTAGKAFQDQYLNALEAMSSESVEYVRGIPVVKTFGQSVFSFKRFYNLILNYKEMVYAYTITWRHPMSAYTMIMQAGGLFLVVTSLFTWEGSDSAGILLSNFILFLMLSPLFSATMMKSMYLQQNKMIAGQVLDRMEGLLDYPDTPPGKQTEVDDTSLAFQYVTFTYPGSDTPAVNSVSFHINPGETVALVGASGGGKTTLARLAARFWDVDSGQVLVGGINVKNIAKETLMDNVSFVFQTTRLMKMSLRDNITFGAKNVTEEAIERAVDLSQSREIIDSLPQGLDTIIGSRGTYLSGGEQQRIALARSILKDAPIVLLDEATAFADPENEHLIRKAFKALSQGKTTLMIAHRLSSVVDADRILVMDKGQIVEKGSHEELLQMQGIYAAMWAEYQTTIDWKIASTKKEVSA
ncbi:MAG: ABC transporter ATP-binding protein [Christensenellales bacterium]